MPVSTQCLYFHLGLNADDDGIVEAFTVMNSVGASEDDLRILVAKGFVFILNEDLVAYIMDWRENNKIRADRKIDSFYKDLLLQVLPEVQLTQKRPRADVQKKQLGQPMDVQWTSSGQPMDGIGKDRVGQDSIGEESVGEYEEPAAPPPAPPAPPKPKKGAPVKHKYGEYGWVKLTDAQYEKLLNDLGEAELQRCIKYVDESAQGNSNKNKWSDWNLIVRKCHREQWGMRKDSWANQQRKSTGFESSNPFVEMLEEERGRQ